MQGLWAELAIILWAADAGAAMSSWHSSPRALHDFSAGGARLEIKSTRKQLREHAFSLDQLATMQPGATLIASIMLRETEGGASVYDMINLIARRVDVRRESVARLEAIVAESLGNGWRDAADQRFSLESARSSLAFYATGDIPTVPQPLPPEVKEVSFVVDLSTTPQLDVASARALAPLFAQLLPRDA